MAKTVFFFKKFQKIKNSQNDFWVIWRIFDFFSFSPFLGGESNPKVGGWILDFAGDVVISWGCLLKLVSPSMIWQCALGGIGGACGEKKSQKWLKSDFQRHNFGGIFFNFFLSPGQGGVDKCQTFFLKASGSLKKN